MATVVINIGRKRSFRLPPTAFEAQVPCFEVVGEVHQQNTILATQAH